MKKEDFERLKAVCEKEGFVIECDYPLTGNVFVKKRDAWEGVEFALSIRNTKRCNSGVIYKIDEDLYHDIMAIEEHSTAFFQPSTEQAYVEQLKKTAFEKFGEIKEGDLFLIEGDIPKCIIPFEKDWSYFKEYDALIHYGITIYKQGKWAERVKERVKVEFFNKKEYGHRLDLNFQLSYKLTLDYKGCQFLASQLEKYLNGEIGEIMTFTESISIPKNYKG